VATRRYTVHFKPSAARAFDRLPTDAKKRVAVAIDDLTTHPRPRGAVKLAGEEDLFRIRAGDYRVIYQIRDRELLVLVVRVGHRRDVYRR
jgi:mRNA interferase RelE/StbE